MSWILTAYLIGVASCLTISMIFGVTDLVTRRWGPRRLRIIGDPAWRWVLKEVAEAVFWPAVALLGYALGARYLMRAVLRLVRGTRKGDE